MRALLVPFAAAAIALALSACEQGSSEADLAKLDNQITGNDADPALTSALEDQIMVDPALTQQSNKNAARAPSSPPQAQYPLPGGPVQPKAHAGARPAGQGSAPVQAAGVAEDPAEGADCGSRLDYNAGWARRLPAAFAVYPGARLTEAAGAEGGGCRARVVTFTTNDAPQRVLDHYRRRATGAGYSAEHAMRGGDHVLAGTAGEAAFYLILTPRRGGGSDVAMITNGG